MDVSFTLFGASGSPAKKLDSIINELHIIASSDREAFPHLPTLFNKTKD